MDTVPESPARRPGGPQVRAPRPWPAFAVCAAVLALAFALPLSALPRFALKSDLYSHILLVPFVSGYLIWLRKADLAGARPGRRPVWPVLLPVLAGVASLGAWVALSRRAGPLAQADYLSYTVFAFVCFLIAGFVWCFGWDTARRQVFPLGFLLFMAPFPVAVVDASEEFLRQASALTAAGFFAVTGETVLRDGTVFHLPGIHIEVARECSGIHSTLALLMTSLVAGHMFLRSPWKKAALAFAVVPLGIVRNGFRVLVISLLCVHVDPGMIDSPIHHQGGPIFFALFLVPFVGLLYLLRRWEGPGKPRKPSSTGPARTAT